MPVGRFPEMEVVLPWEPVIIIVQEERRRDNASETGANAKSMMPVGNAITNWLAGYLEIFLLRRIIFRHVVV